MGFWFTLILWAVTFVLSELLRPKPKLENARPAGLGDFNFPTATEGRVVPIIWGTIKMQGPNVVWYGGLEQVPIIKKQKTGMFSSVDQIIGYEYYVGIQFALCRGEVGKLFNIWVGDKLLWTGTQTGAGTISVDDPEFLGGPDLGYGGISGDITFVVGTEAQSANAYLSAYQLQGGDTPAYRGTCYVVFEGGYIGNTTTIQPWKFELQRIPNGLGLATPTVNTFDANPMNVLYEIFTNEEWGMGLPPSDIDVSNFEDCADTLLTEGNGFSFILDGSVELVDLIKQVEQQIDGIVVLDRLTGKWKCTLARGGYTIGSLPAATDSNVKDVVEFSRGSWDETSTEVRVGFTNRANDYFQTFAMAQDMANNKIQGQNVVAQINYPGVMDADLANNLAWRDLRGLSRPTAKVRLIVNRSFYNTNPGDVISFTNTALGISLMAIRITKVDMGRLDKGEIELNGVEDVYTFEDPAFAAPGPTGWAAPDNTALDITTGNRLIFEAPRAFADRAPVSPGVYRRIWMGGRNPGSGAVIARIDVAGVELGTLGGFILAGKLANAVNPEDHGGNIEIVADPDTRARILDQLETYGAANDDDIGIDLKNLCYVNGEFFAFKTYTDLGTNIRLDNCYRGLCDSAPGIHAANDRVWLMFTAGNITDTSFNSSPVSVKLLTQTNTETLASGSASASSVTIANRHLLPYPPTKLSVHNAVFTNSSRSLDTAVGATDDGKGLEVEWVRRDYQVTDEVLAALTEGPLPVGFPTDLNTRYKVTVINDPLGTPVTLFDTGFLTSTNQALLSRTKILRYTDGVVPSTIKLAVDTRHTIDSVDYNATQQLVDIITVASAELAGQINMGALDDNEVGTLYTTSAPDTGTYAFAIQQNLLSSAAVEARINGGAWTTVISTGNTTGNLAGVTAGDTVEVRHTQSGAGTSETLLTVTPPVDATIGYAVLII